ncbi:MAG: hypothetical protein H6541_00780 [Lentimicrobiaceae bacterium]|nr:hypothetical protein [Lentimicrobiaceae bacterium]MCO5266124.1 hypothetical protein [Lentimicrobium sp.]
MSFDFWVSNGWFIDFCQAEVILIYLNAIAKTIPFLKAAIKPAKDCFVQLFSKKNDARDLNTKIHKKYSFFYHCLAIHVYSGNYPSKSRGTII